MKFKKSKSKTLICYVIAERSAEYFKDAGISDAMHRELYKENINFFINHGARNDDFFETVFICNGDTSFLDIDFKNFKVFHRENKDGDFAAWHYGVRQSGYRKFDFFIFLNDTCRGPFVPEYVPKEISWQEMFLSKIDDETKLVGPTWNFTNTKHKKDLHVQSYAWGTDRKTLEMLARRHGFAESYTKWIGPCDFADKKWKCRYIHWAEIGVSKLVLDRQKKKIGCFMPSQYEFPEHQTIAGDCVKPNGYYGSTLHPFDVMFVKTNRINTLDLQNLTRWKNNKLLNAN